MRCGEGRAQPRQRDRKPWGSANGRSEQRARSGVWQPVASSAGLGPVERGLFGQTSRACRGERKNEALGRGPGAGVLPLRGHASFPRAPWAPRPRGLPGRVRGAAATPWRAGQRAAALALRVGGLVDEGQVLAGVIQRGGRGRGGRGGRGGRLGLHRERGRRPAGGLRRARRRRQEGPLLLQRRWCGGPDSLGHPRRHRAGPAGGLRREAAHLREK